MLVYIFFTFSSVGLLQDIQVRKVLGNIDRPIEKPQLLCLVGWLNAYLQSTAVWNVWEALGMFSVSTAIEQERQTEDKAIMFNTKPSLKIETANAICWNSLAYLETTA